MPPKKLNQSVEPESPSPAPRPEASPTDNMSQVQEKSAEVTDRPAASDTTSNTNSASNNNTLQRRAQPTYDDDDSELEDFVAPKPRKNRRMIPVHQSRIADRPIKKGAEDSSLKIKIELDLEVEVS